MWGDFPPAGRGSGSFPVVMELFRLGVDIATTTAKVWIGFLLLLWIAGKFGIPALTSALGKVGIGQ